MRFVSTVSLGCFHDDLRSQPESWAVVGCIPVYDLKVAKLHGRPTEGPNGTQRRIKVLFHQCYAKLLEGWADLTSTIKFLLWSDSVWRRTYLIIAGLICDQPESDDICCDGSQSCKLCKCPKHRMHESGSSFDAKTAADVQQAVRDAYEGKWQGWEQDPMQKSATSKGRPPKPVRLFDFRGGCWHPTDHCTKARYKRARKAIGGVHLMENAFWLVSGFDVQRQTCKDPMHAFEHGVAMKIIKAIIMALHQLETDLEMQPNTLVARLSQRLHNLCSSYSVSDAALLRFVKQQSILNMFDALAANEGVMPDASDVQAFMLVLPFVLDGLVQPEIEAQSLAGHKMADPMVPIITVVNQYLEWYHMYRFPDLDEDEVIVLKRKGGKLVDDLQSVFPFTVTDRVGQQTTGNRSFWCVEKVHSIKHCDETRKMFGCPRNMSAQVTEMKHKQAVKQYDHLTNRSPQLTLSLMKANVRATAAQKLAVDVDKNGLFFWFPLRLNSL